MASIFDSSSLEVTPEQAQAALADDSAQLIDVREPYEWEAGRIHGAQHIELEHLAGRADEVDKEKPVIFQCRMGRRSALATDAFRAVGFDAYNMRGGIQAWTEAGLPLEPDDGHVV